ncbi:Uncharacterized protein Fot_26980 [Forsythia ovata]|uniref:Uncharacterized protein n=1 Tax=Forsythia ovata TaxID=205694 RepID=A0ABD1UDM8_9LAMI
MVGWNFLGYEEQQLRQFNIVSKQPKIHSTNLTATDVTKKNYARTWSMNLTFLHKGMLKIYSIRNSIKHRMRSEVNLSQFTNHTGITVLSIHYRGLCYVCPDNSAHHLKKRDAELREWCCRVPSDRKLLISS